MSKVVKCNSCNIVIDEMLSFIQNKLSVSDEDTLVRICSSSFSSEDIEKSKELLFESVPVVKGIIKRKNKGKEQRDLRDILNVFKSMDPDLFPIFVARDLERLPPIVFDHLDCTKLLKDLLQVQNDIKDLKETYVTQTQLSSFKSDILQMQHDSLVPAECTVNTKRGAWMMDSGPIGLSHINNSSLDEYNGGEECIERPVRLKNALSYKNIMRVDGEPTFCSESCVKPLEVSIAEPRRETSPAESSHVTVTSPVAISPQPITAGIVNNCRTNKVQTAERRHASPAITEPQPRRAEEDEDAGWQRVSYRKEKKPTKYRYIGTAGISKDNEGRFKAAVKNIPIFITKVHKDTTKKDIVDYIYSKIQENIVPEKITFKYDKDYDAYKFFVPANKLVLYLDDKLWPEGIIFRRFVNYKARTLNTHGEVTVRGRDNKLDG